MARRKSKQDEAASAAKKKWTPRFDRKYLDAKLPDLKDLAIFSQYVEQWSAAQESDAEFPLLSPTAFEKSLGYTDGALRDARRRLEVKTGLYLMDLKLCVEGSEVTDDAGNPVIAATLQQARKGSPKGTISTPDVRLSGEMWAAVGNYILDLIEFTRGVPDPLVWTEQMEAKRAELKASQVPQEEEHDDYREDWEIEAERADELEAIEFDEYVRARYIDADGTPLGERPNGREYAHRPRPGSKLPVFLDVDEEPDHEPGSLPLGGLV